MKFQVLKYCLQNDVEQFVSVDIDSEKLGALKDSGSPEAYVFKQGDLLVLKNSGDIFVDRGSKHPAKGLSRLLLGYEKIPFIVGNYRTTGQLRRSLRTLLDNASEKGEKGRYIVGIGESIFQELREEIGKIDRRRKGKLTDGEMVHKTGRSFEYVLGLLSHCEEKPGLAERYVGNSIEVRIVRQLIMRAAETDDNVLRLGDTGTGKELVARAIHDYGKRSGKPLIVINCSAIPGDLLESELFGHRKGAFTNALYDKEGMWKLAHEGTLFLDEIGDLSLPHQAKILRAVEEKKILPVGGKEQIPVNARIIAATNKNLDAMVQNGQFREDLYYRLKEFPISTPKLSSHLEDMDLLAQIFWRRITGDANSRLSREIITELRYYGWPGNVRELKQVLGGMKRIFGVSHPQVKHLKGIFLMNGHMYLENKGDDSPQNVAFLSLDSLGHLRQTEEVLTASESICRSLMRGQNAIGYSMDSLRQLIQHRINELESLCSKPVQFHSEDLFFEVHKAKGKLSYFVGLFEEDQKRSIPYLKKEAMPALEKALQRVMQKIESTMMSDLPPTGYST